MHDGPIVCGPSIAQQPAFHIVDAITENGILYNYENKRRGEFKLARIGRNDPCPCGSGKKFKKCCEKDNTVIQFPSEMVLLEEFIDAKMNFFKYVVSREDAINNEVKKVGDEHGFNPIACTTWQEFFFEWFAFDYHFEHNKSLFDIFLKENQRNYSNRVLNQLSLWPQSYISVYKYNQTLANGKYLLEDCFTGKQVEIYDPELENDLDKLLIMRLLPAGNAYINFHGVMLLPTEAFDILKETIEDAKNISDHDVSWEQFLKNEMLLVSSILVDLFAPNADDEEIDLPDSYAQQLIRAFLQKPQKALGGKSPAEASFIPKLDSKLDKFLVALEEEKYDDPYLDFYPSMHMDYITELLDGSIEELKRFISFALNEKSLQEEALLVVDKMTGEYFPQDIKEALSVWSFYCKCSSPFIKKRGSWAAALEYMINANLMHSNRYNQRELAQKYGVSATTVSKNYNLIVDVILNKSDKLIDDDHIANNSPQMLASAPGAGGKKPNEALMNQIHRELKDKNFESIEEANAFLQKLMEDGIPKIDHSKLTNEAKAQDLIYAAWEKNSKADRVKTAKEALKIDPNCVDAYVLLAEDDASSVEEKEALYIKALEKGKKTLGREFFKENMGSFWLVTETRPFMRAQIGLALLLWEHGRLEEAANVLKEMLRLNTNDNQGVRYILLPLLLELGRLREADRLIEAYRGDDSPQWNYNIALYNFIVDGKNKNSSAWLKDALKDNQFVPQYLLGFSNIPNVLPEYSQPGGRDEAIIYAYFGAGAWRKTKGALDWLRSLIK